MSTFAASDPRLEPVDDSPAARGGRTRVRFPLVLKLFLAIALIIAAVVAISIGITITRAQAVANRTVNESISSAAKLFKDLELNRLRVLSLGVFTLARDANFYAYIESALKPQAGLPASPDSQGAQPPPAPTIDLTDILDQLQQRRDVLGSDLLILTDDQGIVVARTDEGIASGAAEDMYSTQPIVKQSIDSGSIEPFGGVILVGGRLYHAAVAPLSVGANSVRLGYLVNAKAIDEKFANQIAGTTHAEVVFVPKKGTRDSSPAPRSSNAPSADGVIAMSEVQSIFDGGRSVPPHAAKIEGSSFVLTGEPLSAAGKAVGAAVFVRSMDRELAPFRQIERSLLGAGGIALLVAFAIAWMLAKRLTRPIEDLAVMAQAVTAGDYSVRPKTGGTDEVGVLAESFAKMISALRDKAELEQLYEQMATRTGDTRPPVMENVPTVRLDANSSAPTQMQRRDLAPGAVFANRYEIEQILGRGGMGVVYKATDRQLDETVAIKTLPGDVMARSPQDLERFKREIRLARKITHRNVLRTYDYGEAEGVYFISMEYVRGYTLAELLDENSKPSMRVAMGISRQICRGLQAAHEQGIIHRDIKPQNVLIDHKGEVKLMDFGIARMAEAEVMTQQGLIVGTPHYMSPEQVQGKQLDPRSDVYSMGVMMYEMLCGTRPFDADSLTAVLAAHITETPIAPIELRPEMGFEINSIVLKCLAKSPAERYADAGELLASLDRIQHGAANAA